jgi:hypothetical protein
MDLAGTWNTTGTPTLIKANVTDTASTGSPPSLLMDLQVSGASKFSVSKTGIVTVPLGSSAGYYFAGGTVGIYAASNLLNIYSGAVITLVNAASSFGWSDTILTRDTNDVLAQRRGTNAQAFRVYKTYTDASNYERLNVSTDGNAFTGAGVALIQTTAAGTGTERGLFLGGGASGGHLWMTTAGALQFGRTGVNTWWTMSSTGHFLAGSDNTYDIGAIGATRPRQVYVGTKVTTFQFEATGTVGLGKALTSTSYVSFAASTTGLSSLNIAQGAAPTAPVDGDIWREDNTNTGLKIRVNGVTKTITLS